MLLKNKNAIIYGAGGSVGRAVAKAFAKEGAKVFLVGRTIEKLKQTYNEIIKNGGYAEVYKVDALNQKEVEANMKSIIECHKHIDISFNLIGMNDIHGISLVNSTIEDFQSPVYTALKTQFITSTAAAKIMMERGSGVILMLSANTAKKPFANIGGFGVACAAMEALSRQLAVELGKYNIRVNCLRSAGSPDAEGVAEVFDIHAKHLNMSKKDFEIQFSEKAMLKHLPTLNEVANVAAIIASDKATSITAAIINVTCGELAD